MWFKMKLTTSLAILLVFVSILSCTLAASFEVDNPAVNSSKETSAADNKNGCWIVANDNFDHDENVQVVEAKDQSKAKKCAKLVDMVIPNNTVAYSAWKQPRNHALMKVRLFNYVNWEKFKNGLDTKLKVEEIGPFVYSKKLKRMNISIEDDQISFKEKSWYKYLPKKTIAPDTDEAFVPNLPLLSIISELFSTNFILQMSVDLMAKQVDDHVFIKKNVKEFLWGYNDQLTHLTKSLFTQKPHDDDLVSLLRNDTISPEFTINTGQNDINKMNLIEKFNGLSHLEYWNSAECNRLEGSDGFTFPPSMLDKKQTIYIFNPYLCRRLPFVYEKEVEKNNGTKLYRYRLPADVFEDPSHNQGNQCFCDKDSGVCSPRGVFNITTCNNGGAIDIISLPHFYMSEEKLREDVLGLTPDPKLHGSYIDVDPNLGIAVQGRIRFQLNIQVRKTDVFSVVNFLPNGLILPVAWIETEWSDFCNCKSKYPDK